MIIKQSEAVKAYRSAQDLNRQKINSGMGTGKIAKRIFELVETLKRAYDFQTQEEQKIFETHPEFDPSIGGIRLEGKNEDERKQATAEVKTVEKELNELAELDFDMGDYEVFELDLDRFDNIRISGEDIGNLKKFIEFV